MANNDIDKELERAVSRGNLEEVKALLSEGADVNLRLQWDDNTLLHTASSAEVTKELLSRGAQVNARNKYRETPLHSAVTSGSKLELVRELLKHGACVNATNRKGNTALNLAVKRRYLNLELVKELLEYGADINIKNREQRRSENHFSSLDNAVRIDLACAKLLIKYTLLRNYFNTNYRKIIDLSPYEECSRYRELSSYPDDCVREILQMKADGLPLREFFKNNLDMHKVYNNQLSVRLAKIDYSARYPIYNDIILDKVKPYLEKADLLNKLSEIQFYTKLDVANQDVKGKKIILDYDSTYNITEYLSNASMLNLLIAFDNNANKSVIQSSSSLNNLVEPSTQLCETASTNNDTKRARLE